MRLFAIADLHLPGGQDKPMDVFGQRWGDHFAKIKTDWLSRVGSDDLVLLPGDLSWAMDMQNALPDLNAIFALPGKKVILRGNHDYWWPTISRLRAQLPQGAYALQNDALLLDGLLLAGSRGWQLPRSGKTDAQDEKIFKRELVRLEMSLMQARKLSKDLPLVCLMHYPPLLEDGEETGFTELIEKYSACLCLYGHLHGEALRTAFNGEKNGVLYQNVSCDGLDFRLWETQIARPFCSQ